MSRWQYDEGWRWDPRYHWPVRSVSITVTEPTLEDLEEHDRKIKAGAEVVAFGFARCLPAPAPVEREPLLWDGDQA